MKKENKKGFTIVELVIVIAVIAILIAVLIPTFSKIIGKANQSNDTQVVRQLNTAVEIESASNQGKKPDTMHDAIGITTEYGYNVGKIVAKSKLSIAWDVVNKRFVLLDEAEGKYVFPVDGSSDESGSIADKDRINYFLVRKSLSEANGYSVYAGPDWEGTILSLNVGFDAGDNDIERITYTGETSGENVVIRTNGGDLVIDDESTGQINHYGECDYVNVIECHTASYHEFGTVPFIEIAEGRIVLESGSDVNGIHIDKKYLTKPTEESTGTKADSTFATVEIDVSAGVRAPRFSRDSVNEISSDGTKVCTVAFASERNDVILFYNGIYEQVKIDNTDDGARWVNSSLASESTKKAADQLANGLSGERNQSTGKIEDRQVTVSGTEYTLSFNESTREFEVYSDSFKQNKITDEETVKAVDKTAAIESGRDSDKTRVLSSLKGSGTVDDPFQVYDYDTMQKITAFADVDYYWFEVVIAKTDNGKIDCRNDWHSVTLFGNFNGNGVVFENLNKGLFGAVGRYDSETASKYDYSVKDFTISNCNINSSWGWGVIAYTNGNVMLEDISISGTITGTTSVGSFVEMGYLGGDVTFRNCLSTCHLFCNTCGGFFAHAYQAGNIILDNSYFNGSAYKGNGGGDVNYISGNSASNANGTIVFKNMNNVDGYVLPNGILTTENGYTKDSFTCTWAQGINGIKSSKKAGSNAVMSNINNITASYSEGETITLEALTDTKTAQFILMIAPNDSTGYGGYLTGYLSEKADVNNGKISSTAVRYSKVTVDKNKPMGYNSEKTVYNVNQNGWGPSYGSAYIEIQEYNSSDTLIRISRIALPAYVSD